MKKHFIGSIIYISLLFSCFLLPMPENHFDYITGNTSFYVEDFEELDDDFSALYPWELFGPSSSKVEIWGDIYAYSGSHCIHLYLYNDEEPLGLSLPITFDDNKVLSFHVRTSHYLDFCVDDIIVQTILPASPNNGYHAVYKKFFYKPTPGLHKITFQVNEHPNNNTFIDLIELKDINTTNFNNDDFETGNFSANSYELGGDPPFVQNNTVYQGNYALKFGFDSMTEPNKSSIELTLNLSQNISISFYCNVSNYSLRWYVDDVKVDEYESAFWTQKNFSVSSGFHTITWQYESYISTVPIDTAYIDNITITS